MFQLLTPRLVLRDVIVDDWTFVHALSAEPLVTRYQTWLRLPTAQDAQRWVADVTHHNALEPRVAYNLAIVERATEQGMGWIGWGPPSSGDPLPYNFGYALLPTFWHRGYMTEAVRVMLQWAFEHAQRASIFGECAASNGASRRVMEKAGLRLVAHWAEPDEVTGEPQAHLRFAMTMQEWRAAQRP